MFPIYLYQSFYLPTTLRSIRNGIFQLTETDKKTQEIKEGILLLQDNIKITNNRIKEYKLIDKKAVTQFFFKDLCNNYLCLLNELEKKIDESTLVSLIEEGRQAVISANHQEQTKEEEGFWSTVKNVSSYALPIFQIGKNVVNQAIGSPLLLASSLINMTWESACPTIQTLLFRDGTYPCPESIFSLQSSLFNTGVVFGGILVFINIINHLANKENSQEQTIIKEEMSLLELEIDDLLEKMQINTENVIFQILTHKNSSRYVQRSLKELDKTNQNLPDLALDRMLLNFDDLKQITNPSTKIKSEAAKGILAHELGHILNDDCNGKIQDLISSVLTSSILSCGFFSKAVGTLSLRSCTFLLRYLWGMYEAYYNRSLSKSSGISIKNILSSQVALFEINAPSFSQLLLCLGLFSEQIKKREIRADDFAANTIDQQSLENFRKFFLKQLFIKKVDICITRKMISTLHEEDDYIKLINKLNNWIENVPIWNEDFLDATKIDPNDLDPYIKQFELWKLKIESESSDANSINKYKLIHNLINCLKRLNLVAIFWNMKETDNLYFHEQNLNSILQDLLQVFIDIDHPSDLERYCRLTKQHYLRASSGYLVD